MTPFPTKAEHAAASQSCQEAWEKSRRAAGLERMRLINLAFPFAIHGGSALGGLRVSYLHKHQALAVSDGAGFITLIEVDDWQTLFCALGMEAGERGSFRRTVEGGKAYKKPPPKKAHKKISLTDLGL